ncbi:MAG TPA: molybdopterin molybdotransferase MoeA [Candidatus Pelethocola excrementipullorum]|nr:molybdopterin molybdotransferase MoeA [Candidatus Pelethocola excrementipullorum]
MHAIPEGISLEQARELLFRIPISYETTSVPISAACGKILASDYYAPCGLPTFSKSPLDGYAFRSCDSVGASHKHPVALEIIEEIRAGDYPQKALGPFQAAKILTGAPIPVGADAVVRFEDTAFTPDKVEIFRTYLSDTNIIHEGEDMEKGALAASSGTCVTPPTAGLLASLGFSHIEVYQKPSIALISTGNELIEPGNPLGPGKIYNSNLYTIGSYIEAAGAELSYTGMAEDRDDAIASQILGAMKSSQMIVTTGGVSVGDYDRVRTALESFGAEILFWRIALKPGAAILAALFQGRLILGLSGNPGSAATALHLLGVPYIRKLCGRKDILPAPVQALLKEDFNKSSPNRRFLHGKIVYQGGHTYFSRTGHQGNHVISSFVGCDALADIPAGSPKIPAGTMLNTYFI